MTKALQNYKIWLKFSDDTEGVVSFAHLAGKGIFKEWDNTYSLMSILILKRMPLLGIKI